MIHSLVLFPANLDPSTETLDFAIVPSTSSLPAPARNDARDMHCVDTYHKQSQQSGAYPHETEALRDQLSHISLIAAFSLEQSVMKYMISPVELLCRSSKHFCWFPPTNFHPYPHSSLQHRRLSSTENPSTRQMNTENEFQRVVNASQSFLHTIIELRRPVNVPSLLLQSRA